MEKDYDSQLAQLMGQIENLTAELLARPDRQVDSTVHRYLKKMDRLKSKILELKTNHFLKGGLYQ